MNKNNWAVVLLGVGLCVAGIVRAGESGAGDPFPNPTDTASPAPSASSEPSPDPSSTPSSGNCGANEVSVLEQDLSGSEDHVVHTGDVADSCRTAALFFHPDTSCANYVKIRCETKRTDATNSFTAACRAKLGGSQAIVRVSTTPCDIQYIDVFQTTAGDPNTFYHRCGNKSSFTGHGSCCFPKPSTGPTPMPGT